MKKALRDNLMTLLPLALSLLVWLPVLFLLGGSIMGGAEIRELLLPALQEGVGGYAKWRLLPLYPTLAPYVGLLLDTPSFFVMYWNSVIITAGSLLGQCLIAVPAAWWFAGTRSRTGAGLFSLYTALMLMPFQVTMLPHYLVLDHMGLMDTHWGLVFPAAFSTFPVFIMYRFFRAIPPSMKEAAQIDGCGGFRLFISIGLPLGKPGVASAMILGFFEAWNLIEQPMTFLKTKSLWPLSLFLPEITKSTIGFSLAASVVTLLPSLLVFLIGQSYLEQGIIGSAVKE